MTWTAGPPRREKPDTSILFALFLTSLMPYGSPQNAETADQFLQLLCLQSTSVDYSFPLRPPIYFPFSSQAEQMLQAIHEIFSGKLLEITGQHLRQGILSATVKQN